MKHTFVLNENIVIAVSTLKNERGQHDRTSAKLVNAIVANCHRIAWSLALYERWSRQVQTLQNQGSAIAPSFMTLFSQAFTVEGKVPQTGNPPPTPWRGFLEQQAPRRPGFPTSGSPIPIFFPRHDRRAAQRRCKRSWFGCGAFLPSSVATRSDFTRPTARRYR